MPNGKLRRALVAPRTWVRKDPNDTGPHPAWTAVDGVMVEPGGDLTLMDVEYTPAPIGEGGLGDLQGCTE
jgi:hypothetical protein